MWGSLYKRSIGHGASLLVCGVLLVGKATYAQERIDSLQQKTVKEVQVTAFGKNAQWRKSEFPVTSVDMKMYQEGSLDLAQILDKAAGVKIQQDGGMGSNVQWSIHGLQGNQVKIFIDGIPLEGFGPTFQLNNIAVNLIDRIDIYKGVVPTGLPSDALGGAMNIITKTDSDYLDVSYSFGSFNTHKSSVHLAQRYAKGFVLYADAFQHYSDNSYPIQARILDLESGTYSEETQRVRRFHDRYRNETILLKTGWENRRFADQLLVGFTWGQVHDQIQHAADMDKVFGDKARQATTLAPSLVYRKRDILPHLDVHIAGNFNFGTSENRDTSQFIYNWRGDRVLKRQPGEQRYSLYDFRNNNGFVSGMVTYRLHEQHGFAVQTAISTFDRKGHDQYREFFTSLPSKMVKQVSTASYRYSPSPAWATTIFGKRYANTVEAFYSSQDQSAVGNFEKKTDKNGWGIASVYRFLKDWQLRASYESAVRLPTSRELFGLADGIEEQQVELRPETSDNLNVGLQFNKLKNNHLLLVNVDYAYRNARDFINRRNRNGVFRAENFGKTRIQALDMQLRYTYADWLMAGTTWTIQDIRNNQQYIIEDDLFREDYFYGERLPNLPYFYGNWDIGFLVNGIRNPNDAVKLTIFGSYVRHFTNDWDRYASSATIPTQHTFDLQLLYSWRHKRYNLALDALNIFDVARYDNYNLQRPGRSFAIKAQVALK